MCPPQAPDVRQQDLGEDDIDISRIPLNIAYINRYGQSIFPVSKQPEIQNYICKNNLDIIHLQEVKNDSNSFSQCKFVINNLNIFANNKPDESYFGTASLVRSDLDVTDIHTDDDGQTIIFNAAGCTWGNFYLQA